MDDRTMARGLAWFGIGLGLAETVAPRRVAEATGLEGHEGLIQLYGLREIASGVAILAAAEPERHLGVRVAGDLLDGALLAARATPANPRRGRTLAAALAVAPVVLLDTVIWLKARNRPRRIPPSPAERRYVRYNADVETIGPDEDATIDQIIASQKRLHARNQAIFGRPVRVSHGKLHGAAVGELDVLPNLPPWLRQGLFAEPARYPVVARLANVPGEIASDAVATQRGFSFKVIGVPGAMLPEHAGERTQDFVLDSGDRFAAGTAKQFLANHRALEHGSQIPDGVKAAVSAVARAGNAALESVGAGSAMLDFFGHPRVHPLAEAYFSQAPLRFGAYIAKLAVVPVGPAQRVLAEAPVDTNADPDALRTATVGYLRAHEATFDIRVQLCTDRDRMPVEDASAEWREDESPYQTVARLRFPRQDAFTPERRAYVDEALSFCVSHSLAEHRPLGSINRARLRAYPELARLRREAGGQPVREPRSIAEIPA
ncbi:catalase family protein [Methylobacterium sp. E-005]|uniref:catalase family protein n=1 Tax=Methylobacterium sp. E-005 TaxID=2836549 RepID=UPI001FBC12CD|nr:catalase family protein [Methylobacterium sp. E-005]MCJ2085969.1 catalase family protein [Methylobacterium sp. E-005]